MEIIVVSNIYRWIGLSVTNVEDLMFLVNMYQEKDEGMKSNPDLYFNSATVSCILILLLYFIMFKSSLAKSLEIENVSSLLSCNFGDIFISSAFPEMIEQNNI